LDVAFISHASLAYEWIDVPQVAAAYSSVNVVIGNLYTLAAKLWTNRDQALCMKKWGVLFHLGPLCMRVKAEFTECAKKQRPVRISR
jgi:hypothetical protein